MQEWKDTLLRGYDSESFKKYYSQFSQENATVQSQLLKLKEDMDALVKEIEDKAKSETENMIKQSSIDENNFKNNLIGIASLGIILIALFTYLILSTYKDITKFIAQFKLLLNQAESGDLTIKGEIYKKDELGQLTERFNSFIYKIRSLISEASETSITVASSSNEILRTSDEISKASEEVACTITNIAESSSKQAELAEQSNTSVNDVVQGVNRITENTVYISELANKGMETVSNGTESLRYQIDRMSNTKNASQNVSNVISNLSTKSNEIGKVIEFINGITEKINLLALNASIEAARAGEAGRGFAVVASEIEKLAELSKKSTQKISNLIVEVQTDIEKAVTEVTNTNISIDEQATSLKLTDDSFNFIQKSVFEVTNKIKEVTIETSAINENAISVGKSIKNIVNIIEQNASSTENLASTTEEHAASIQEVASSMNILEDLSGNLQKAIAKFKV